VAIRHALAVLGWMELPEDDQPPETIWLDGEAIAEHFERVNDRYKAKSQGMEVVEDLEQNQLTKGLRGK
jgi:hypothetical protein